MIGLMRGCRRRFGIWLGRGRRSGMQWSGILMGYRGEGGRRGDGRESMDEWALHCIAGREERTDFVHCVQCTMNILWSNTNAGRKGREGELILYIMYNTSYGHSVVESKRRPCCTPPRPICTRPTINRGIWSLRPPSHALLRLMLSNSSCMMPCLPSANPILACTSVRSRRLALALLMLRVQRADDVDMSLALLSALPAYGLFNN